MSRSQVVSATTRASIRYRAMPHPTNASIPTDSLIFGYGPMLPFIAAAIGSWILPPPWPSIAVKLVIIWGSLILAFVAGVRRGFGFGTPTASTRAEIVTMLAYFVPAGLALVLAAVGVPVVSLALLAIGFALVILLDRRAALAGDAPAYFAALRPRQMGIAVAALTAVLAHLI